MTTLLPPPIPLSFLSTTTRDAFDAGALVVTLPAKYLGSRWSTAYYNIIGVTDLVAQNKSHYVDLAVHFARNIKARRKLQDRVQKNLHKMYHQDKAVESWTNALLDISGLEINRVSHGDPLLDMSLGQCIDSTCERREGHVDVDGSRDVQFFA